MGANVTVLDVNLDRLAYLDDLNGLMAFLNLIALFALSGVIIASTRGFFGNKENLQ